MHNIKTSKLPEYTSAEELSSHIANVFKDKIATVHTSLEEIKQNYNLDLEPETQLLANEANLTLSKRPVHLKSPSDMPKFNLLSL